MGQYGDKSLSSLFGKKNPQGTGPSKFLASASMDSLGDQIESAGYIRAELENKQRVVPTVDFARPENFAKYGSAEEYYKTSIERIYKTYPYDGSKKEKIQWSLSSSYLDNYIFENEYPRANGFVNLAPAPKATDTAEFISNSATSTAELYYAHTTPQYISVKGGPNKASLPIYDQGLNKSIDFKKPEQKANFYDTSNNRESNITIDGTKGNTIEFWFKNNKTQFSTRALFDVCNDDGTALTQFGGERYGRILIENRIASDGSLIDTSWFHLTYMSGTAGAERVPIYSAAALGMPANDVWNHFAITIKNSGNEAADKGLSVKTFLNGVLVDNKLTGSEISKVRGTTNGGIDAYINAYKTFPTDYVKVSSIAQGRTSMEGNGPLSASFDEFRFWKTARTEKQIGTNWFTQVGAGTNTDTANTNLGFYFKFNEGIVGITSTDQTILDYSGRVSNGTYVNYLPANETTNIDEEGYFSRSTGSAIVTAEAAEKEFKDPILYPNNPNISAYKTNAMQYGREWDYRNPAMMFNSLPSWIQEDDSNGGDNIRALTQIMSSYLDTLHLQIEEMKKIKEVRYLSGSSDADYAKPIPFASKLLVDAGFIAPEIFADTDVVAALSHRDDKMEYEKKLYDIKNYIYQNIYNNLTYINKSKGTTKAIRNLIRCFGVGDEIYKVNMYADNTEYTLTDNFEEKNIIKSYVDFNHIDKHNATVYSYKNAGESNNLGFITGSHDTTSGFDRGMAMTVESEIILPKKPDFGSNNFEKYYFPGSEVSLFGMHSAIPGASDLEDTTWDSDDYANFQVYALLSTSKLSEESSKAVKFVLKSYNSVLPELTSSFYIDQYQDTKWNFAVRVKPKGYPNVGSTIVGATGKEYDVEFEGFSTTSDVVLNHFLATGSISNTAGLNFMTQNKKMYVGAHRTNFTASVREKSDVLVTSCRYWADNISSEELKGHAIDPKSYGIQDPEKNAYLFVTKYDPKIEVPRINTLALNWEFETMTGSDGSGRFVVKDSSYTINQDIKRQLWETDLGNLLDSNNDARGDFFEANDNTALIRKSMQSFSQQVPENINDSNMITVATTDDLTFTKNTLPVKFSFALEKSMYNNISEEILKFFYASKEASSLDNLVGNPVNRYRINYKSLEKVRNIFFNTIGNVPDLEKYLTYYKWLDNSISEMVKEIVPISANIVNATNVIESHMLERGGKYQSKFPSTGKKLGVIEGIAEGSGG